jgi:hypothetical protein
MYVCFAYVVGTRLDFTVVAGTELCFVYVSGTYVLILHNISTSDDVHVPGSQGLLAIPAVSVHPGGTDSFGSVYRVLSPLAVLALEKTFLYTDRVESE